MDPWYVFSYLPVPLPFLAVLPGPLIANWVIVIVIVIAVQVPAMNDPILLWNTGYYTLICWERCCSYSSVAPIMTLIDSLADPVAVAYNSVSAAGDLR